MARRDPLRPGHVRTPAHLDHQLVHGRQRGQVHGPQAFAQHHPAQRPELAQRLQRSLQGAPDQHQPGEALVRQQRRDRHRCGMADLQAVQAPDGQRPHQLPVLAAPGHRQRRHPRPALDPVQGHPPGALPQVQRGQRRGRRDLPDPPLPRFEADDQGAQPRHPRERGQRQVVLQVAEGEAVRAQFGDHLDPVHLRAVQYAQVPQRRVPGQRGQVGQPRIAVQDQRLQVPAPRDLLRDRAVPGDVQPADVRQPVQGFQLAFGAHVQVGHAHGGVGQHRLRVHLHGEPPPGVGQFTGRLVAVVRPEAHDHLERPVAAHQRRRTDRRGRLALAQPGRFRQQLQHQLARLGQPLGLARGTRGQQPRRTGLHLAPDLRIQLRRVLQTGSREQHQPAAVALGLVGPGQQLAQDVGAFVGPGVTHRHPDHVVPGVLVGVVHQHAEVPCLHRRLGAEVVLEGAVDEVHRARHRLPEQPAADQQVAEDRLGTALRLDLRHRVERLGDHPDRLVGRRLHLPVADQPVREPLEQQGLLVPAEVDALDPGDVPLAVAADQEHVQGGVVELLAGPGQMHPPVPVQCAQQGAHQRVRGEPAQVAALAHGLQERLLVPVEQLPLPLRPFTRPFARTPVGAVGLHLRPGGGVPVRDEGLDVLALHRQQGEGGEPLGGQPVLRDGRGAGGDHEAGRGVGGQQRPEPGLGPAAQPRGHLVDPVDQHQRPSRGEQPLHPARRRRQRHARGVQPVLGPGQPGGGVEGAQRQDEGDQGVPVPQLGAEAAAGRVEGQPLDEGALARSGRAAQQHPLGGVQGRFGLDRRLQAGLFEELRPADREADVGQVQRPFLAGLAEGQAEELDPPLGLGHVLRVPRLEGRRGVLGLRAGRGARGARRVLRGVLGRVLQGVRAAHRDQLAVRGPGLGAQGRSGRGRQRRAAAGAARAARRVPVLRPLRPLRAPGGVGRVRRVRGAVRREEGPCLLPAQCGEGLAQGRHRGQPVALREALARPGQPAGQPAREAP